MIALVDSKLMAYNSSYNLERSMGSVFEDLRYVLEDLAYAHKDQVTKVVLGFDYGKSHFRKTLYPEYKGGRKYNRVPEDFQDNYRYKLPELAKALGLGVLGVEGVECDDLIGILLAGYTGTERVVLVTGDRDWLQLTIGKPRIIMYDPKQRQQITTDCKSIPQFLVEKIMKGDTSDNLQGIYNCGPVAYSEFAEKAFNDHRSYTGTYKEQLDFLYSEYLAFGQSHSKYRVHNKYHKFGVTTLEELFEYNLQLGEIFSDFSRMTEEQITEFLKAKDSLAKATPASIGEIQGIYQEIAGGRTGMFGDPISMDISTINYFRGINK